MEKQPIEKRLMKQQPMEKQPIIIHNHYNYNGPNIMGETHISGGTHILGNNDGTQTFNDIKGNYIAGNVVNETEVTNETDDTQGEIPPELATSDAEILLHKLVEEGMLDDNYQPVGLTRGERGILASVLADRLQLKHHWKTFEKLWSVKSSSLRGAYNQAMERCKTLDFIVRLNAAL